MDIVFLDIGLLLIIGTIMAFFARYYKQPLIPAYIFAGLLIGPGLEFLLQLDFVQMIFNVPADFTLISNKHLISTLSEIGIAFLLFIVGLEIDLKKIKDNKNLCIFGTILQVASVFMIGFVIARAFGLFNLFEAIYIAIALVFSSTMVALKILSDRKELDTLHGRIVLGVLLVQDIIAILVLVFMNSVGGLVLSKLFYSLLFGGALILISGMLGRYFFPVLFKHAAKSQETLLLVAMSVCFAFGIIFAGAGFSIAIGSFVAGIVLGNLPYSFEIIGRIKSLRDFFVTLFFVSLGLQLEIGLLRGMFMPLMLFLFVIVFVKPFIVMMLMFMFGYKRRTAFLSALSLSQISEFAIIIVAQGMLLGHVTSRIFSFVIMLAILSIALSAYMIRFEYKLYDWMYKDLALFEKVNTFEDKLEYKSDNDTSDVLLIGYSRTGFNIFHKLRSMRKEFMVVDFNPEVIKKLIKEKVPCIYGDIANHEILKKIDFRKMKFIISTIPDPFASKLLIKTAKKKNKDVVVFVTSYHVEDAMSLYDTGADYVILPHFLGGYHASVLLEEVSTDITKLIKMKTSHLKELTERKELGHHYPSHHKHEDHDHKHQNGKKRRKKANYNKKKKNYSKKKAISIKKNRKKDK